MKIARGTVYNYYSPSDKTLFMFKSIILSKPIGTIPLLEVKQKEKMSDGEIIKQERFRSMTDELRIVNINSEMIPERARIFQEEFFRIFTSVGL